MLTPSASRVYVCRTSTKSASSGDRRCSFSTSSNRGPAGSRPVTNAKFSQLRKTKPAPFAYLCCAELTGDPANGPSHVRPGVSGYMGAQTVADEVHVLQRELLLVLLEKEVVTVTSAAATTDTKPTFNKSWGSASCHRLRWHQSRAQFNPDQI